MAGVAILTLFICLAFYCVYVAVWGWAARKAVGNWKKIPNFIVLWNKSRIGVI